MCATLIIINIAYCVIIVISSMLKFACVVRRCLKLASTERCGDDTMVNCGMHEDIVDISLHS